VIPPDRWPVTDPEAEIVDFRPTPCPRMLKCRSLVIEQKGKRDIARVAPVPTVSIMLASIVRFAARTEPVTDHAPAWITLPPAWITLR
jgi:hypothetical protein